MKLAVFLALLFCCCSMGNASVAAEKAVTPIASTSSEVPPTEATDLPKQLQAKAIEDDKAAFGYWGTDPDKYTGWKSHSNRLIPVYTFGSKGGGGGVDLDSYTGSNSVYRSEAKVQTLYGYVPEKTVNPQAVWMDQTNVADLQRAGAAAGKKYIFLVVFDGMDWQTTRAAAIWNQQKVTYTEGRGHGTHFQDYDANGTTQFGFFVSSAHNEGTDVDVNAQTVQNPGGTIRGGYDAASAGSSPWDIPPDPGYLIAKPAGGNPKHDYTDSSSSATSMTAAIKTFNGGVNVDSNGTPVKTVAHELQSQGWRVGAISSVPISHATPAAAYAHNVSRDDYQDLTRDMLGLPSIQHPQTPLLGLDVVIGGGYGHPGDAKKGHASQGTNFVEGNLYLTDADLQSISVDHGGRYVTAVRTAGHKGSQVLRDATAAAVKGNHRLLGFFGNGQYNGHLPFATADRRYDPAPGVGKKGETYSAADVAENPTLAEMTTAALTVLGRDQKPFWIMVESGDVDWANHDNNIDTSIGAVNTGDDAVKVITQWVESHSNWHESLLILTADHGHMLNLVKPELLISQ
ncbi:MAG: alkaline phosphatase [Planctomycetota bacterium]|nr:MAG: alkaline phosphatase [Planctomycetota bacterium]